ncbi:hypothetical protein MHB77_30140 [Paenibacillus sp. FSL K6-3166]|uniref:hypothetical protein n=1 Tax=Paenibacillus sp. FSL K6-3166 TaxID=2921492 RepID=UPI0030F6D46F
MILNYMTSTKEKNLILNQGFILEEGAIFATTQVKSIISSSLVEFELDENCFYHLYAGELIDTLRQMEKGAGPCMSIFGVPFVCDRSGLLMFGEEVINRGYMGVCCPTMVGGNQLHYNVIIFDIEELNSQLMVNVSNQEQ